MSVKSLCDEVVLTGNNVNVFVFFPYIQPQDIDSLSVFSFFQTERSLYNNQTHSRLIESSTSYVPDPQPSVLSVPPTATFSLTRGSVYRSTPIATSKKNVVSQTMTQKTTSAAVFLQATTAASETQRHETITKCLPRASVYSNSAYCVSNFGCVTGVKQRSLAGAIGLTTIRDMHEAVEHVFCLNRISRRYMF